MKNYSVDRIPKFWLQKSKSRAQTSTTATNGDTITKQNVASEMAMDLCINEKDEKRESEAQSHRPPARASSPSRLTEPRSLALHLSR